MCELFFIQFFLTCTHAAAEAAAAAAAAWVAAQIEVAAAVAAVAAAMKTLTAIRQRQCTSAARDRAPALAQWRPAAAPGR